VRDEEFIAARLDTGFISRFNQRRKERPLERPHPAGGSQAASLHQDIAIIAAALSYARAPSQLSTNHVPPDGSKWKVAGRVAGLNRTALKRSSEHP